MLARNPLTTPRPVLASDVDRTHDDPLRGIGLVFAAMVLFAGSDTLAKHLSATLPAIEIAWLRWLGFVTLLLPVILRSRGAVLRSKRPGLQVLRTFGLLGSAGFFIQSLHVMPLATASAIAFAAPIFVTALSIPILGEVVGIRRWAAVFVGLGGVLLVIQPGGGTLGTAALYPLLSALGWAVGMIATRLLGGVDRAATTMAYSALVGAAVLSLLVPFDWVVPTKAEVGAAVLMALASTSAQFLIVVAYRYAKASVLAPMSYSIMIWSTLLGYLVFGNIPDAWTWAGGAIIIGSGIYTAHREHVAFRARAATG